ncbi:Histidine protein methyltransferase 1, partial [Cichlidogyrus casuarinus]
MKAGPDRINMSLSQLIKLDRKKGTKQNKAIGSKVKRVKMVGAGKTRLKNTSTNRAIAILNKAKRTAAIANAAAQEAAKILNATKTRNPVKFRPVQQKIKPTKQKSTPRIKALTTSALRQRRALSAKSFNSPQRGLPNLIKTILGVLVAEAIDSAQKANPLSSTIWPRLVLSYEPKTKPSLPLSVRAQIAVDNGEVLVRLGPVLLHALNRTLTATFNLIEATGETDTNKATNLARFTIENVTQLQHFALDGHINIDFISDSCVEQFLKSQSKQNINQIDEKILCAFSGTEAPNDVIPGVIEGGFTVWTGSKLLTKHLHQLVQHGELIIKGARVLELGCGAGIPAIYCLSQTPKSVYLQEYNRDVLRICTIANVKACKFDSQAAQFVAADWSTLSKEWPTPRFDLVIGSETIYREDLYAPQLQLIKQVLQPTGLAILVLKA